MLTKLERTLRGLTPIPPIGEPGFLDGLAARLLGPGIRTGLADQAAYVVLCLGAGLAGLRLATT